MPFFGETIDKMWKQFSYEAQRYFFDISYKYDVFTVYLNDFTKVWKGVYSNEAILDLFKESNSSTVTIEENKILILFDTDLNPQNADITKNIIIKEDTLVLKLISNSKEYSFNCTLYLVSPDEFYQIVTLPLLMIVKELNDHKEKLKRTIKEKDEEISEYKLGGAKLFRTYLQTLQFDDNDFVKECSQKAMSNLLESINSIDKVFDNEIKSLYTSAVEICKNYSEKKQHVVKENEATKSGATESEKDTKRKNIKWEIEPQNVKRYKTKQTRIKI